MHTPAIFSLRQRYHQRHLPVTGSHVNESTLIAQAQLMCQQWKSQHRKVPSFVGERIAAASVSFKWSATLANSRVLLVNDDGKNSVIKKLESDQQYDI